MRFMFRWTANAVSFYLALYLVDSLVAPRFWIEAVWIAVVLAVVLGLLNSLVRPLHRIRRSPRTAVIVALMTVLVNTLIMQIAIWAGAPLSATHLVWVLIAAAFLSLLAGVLNWLIGFKPKDNPGALARERRAAKPGGERAARAPRARD
jgi:putative membrane protein